MDILSHALWTNLIFKETPVAQRSLVVFFGVLPDFISFSLISVKSFFKKTMSFKELRHAGIPEYVFQLYNFTHSLVIWLAFFIVLKLFGLDWGLLPIYGWGLHILLDIFTHTTDFFPTPILWPFSKFHFSGINWSNKWFMLFNYCVLLFLYLVFYF